MAHNASENYNFPTNIRQNFLILDAKGWGQSQAHALQYAPRLTLYIRTCLWRRLPAQQRNSDMITSVYDSVSDSVTVSVSVSANSGSRQQ